MIWPTASTVLKASPCDRFRCSCASLPCVRFCAKAAATAREFLVTGAVYGWGTGVTTVGGGLDGAGSGVMRPILACLSRITLGFFPLASFCRILSKMSALGCMLPVPPPLVAWLGGRLVTLCHCASGMAGGIRSLVSGCLPAFNNHKLILFPEF